MNLIFFVINNFCKISHVLAKIKGSGRYYTSFETQAVKIMFNLNKLINKTEKKNKNNPKTQDKGKKKGNECSRTQSLQSNESQGSKKISSFNINEDVYALQYKGESAFFAQVSSMY